MRNKVHVHIRAVLKHASEETLFEAIGIDFDYADIGIASITTGILLSRCYRVGEEN